MPVGRRTATLRCAWITPVLGMNGDLLYLGPLLRTMATLFMDFTVLTAEFRGSKTAAGFRIEQCGTLRRMYGSSAAGPPASSSYPSGFTISGPRVLKRLAVLRPDVIVINEFSLFALYSALVRFRRRKTAVLWLIEARPRHAGSGTLKFVRKFVRRRLARLADICLTNNADGASYLVDELGVAPKRIMAAPYVVSDFSRTTTFSGVRHCSREEIVRFLYVGRLLRPKGLDVAIEAIRRIRSGGRDDFTLDIVGEGPWRAQLELQVEQAELGKCVIFHGRKPYEQLGTIYRDSHVFIFPTFADYRALAPFEAISTGLPIIASCRDGGITETVDPGGNGFSFDPYRPEELVRHLEFFLDHRESIEPFSRRSLEIARSFTLDSAVATLQRAVIAALDARDQRIGRRHGNAD